MELSDSDSEGADAEDATYEDEVDIPTKSMNNFWRQWHACTSPRRHQMASCPVKTKGGTVKTKGGTAVMILMTSRTHFSARNAHHF